MSCALRSAGAEAGRDLSRQRARRWLTLATLCLIPRRSVDTSVVNLAGPPPSATTFAPASARCSGWWGSYNFVFAVLLLTGRAAAV